MNCPICNIALTMAERNGVEIDYCSKCRGVWLDRGELDKIIERASGATSSSSTPPATSQHDEDADDENRARTSMSGQQQRNNRENPIADLFDFF